MSGEKLWFSLSLFLLANSWELRALSRGLHSLSCPREGAQPGPGPGACSPLVGKGAPVEDPLGGLVLQLLAQGVGDGDERGVQELQCKLRPGDGHRH